MAIDGLRLLIYSRKLEKNYSKWHHHYLLTNGITDGIFGIIYQIHRRKYRRTKKIMSVICYIHRWRSWWNEAGNFFSQCFVCQ